MGAPEHFPIFFFSHTYRVRERIKGRGASISRQIYKQKTVKKLPRCAENSLVWNIKKYWKVSMTFTCRVEWFSNFFDFWKPTHFCWSGIFLGTQLKKICNFGCAAKFLFSENHRDLKIFLLLKICSNFPIFCMFQKWATLFKVKITIFLNFSSFLALKKIKEYVPPCRRLQKHYIQNFCADFIILATTERVNIKTWNFGIGVQQQFWHNIECVAYLFLQNTPPCPSVCSISSDYYFHFIFNIHLLR